MIRLAIDAMGGDNAPQSVIDGLSLFLKREKDVSFCIFGDQNKIESLV